MRIIDDAKYFETQRKWFNTQIAKGNSSDCWLDFEGAKMALTALRNDELKQGEWDELDLFRLRSFLNDTGIKKLNNAISAFKKREKKNLEQKQILVYLKSDTVRKLNRICKTQDLTQSDLLEILISGYKFEDQLGLEL